MEVKYENLLHDPVAELSRIAEFCELSVGTEALCRVAGNVRSDRAYAYMRSEELREFADANRSTLSEYGYDRDAYHTPAQTRQAVAKPHSAIGGITVRAPK